MYFGTFLSNNHTHDHDNGYPEEWSKRKFAKVSTEL